jgi:hypothetical protein
LDYILSQTGARQGDALGPLFFCLGSLALLQRIQEQLPSGKVIAYLDDIFIIGPQEEVSNAIRTTVEFGPQLGNFLNDTKSKILLSPSTQPDYYRSFFPPSSIIPADEGVNCLGTPIGSITFQHNFLSNKLAELRGSSNLALQLTNKQCHWLVLFHILRGK